MHSTRAIIRPFFSRVGVMTSRIPGHDVCCIDRLRDEREKEHARARVGKNERKHSVAVVYVSSRLPAHLSTNLDICFFDFLDMNLLTVS